MHPIAVQWCVQPQGYNTVNASAVAIGDLPYEVILAITLILARDHDFEPRVIQFELSLQVRPAVWLSSRN